MSTTSRIRRSATQWQQLISEQAESGLSQAAFCKRKRLPLSTFTHWKRRLSIELDEQERNTPDQSSWIELGSLAGKELGWDIELDLGGGMCLRLRRG